MTVLTVLVFGPESASYERSRRETAAKFHHFSARIFFAKLPKSQDSMIYYILVFFPGTYSKNGFFPYAFQSPDPAARPAVRPSWITGYQNEWFSSISRITSYHDPSARPQIGIPLKILQEAFQETVSELYRKLFRKLSRKVSKKLLGSSPGSTPGSSIGSCLGSSPGSSRGSFPGSFPGSSLGSSPGSSLGLSRKLSGGPQETL